MACHLCCWYGPSEHNFSSLIQVFFIDHPHCLTTFVDPRLPLPDQQFTYTTPSQSIPTNRKVNSYNEVGGQLYTHTHTHTHTCSHTHTHTCSHTHTHTCSHAHTHTHTHMHTHTHIHTHTCTHTHTHTCTHTHTHCTSCRQRTQKMM